MIKRTFKPAQYHTTTYMQGLIFVPASGGFSASRIIGQLTRSEVKNESNEGCQTEVHCPTALKDMEIGEEPRN